MFSYQSSYIPTLVMSHSWIIIQGDRRGNARAPGQITSNFLTQASWRLYEIRQPSTSLCTTSNFRDGTGRDKLTFKLYFPGNLWLAAFAILAIFLSFLESNSVKHSKKMKVVPDGDKGHTQKEAEGPSKLCNQGGDGVDQLFSWNSGVFRYSPEWKGNIFSFEERWLHVS